MSVTVDLPAEVLERLRAEAARRGLSIDEVIAELAEQLPTSTPTPSTQRTLAFVGAGASDGGITPYMERALADGFGRD
ncbi:MAG: CopG family transcriptional regulator [Actinomycetes bacterium]